METVETIRSVIEELRPFLQRDGGDIEYVDFLADTKTVLVRLKGACFGCPMSILTLKNFVEKRIKEVVAEVNEVQVAK